ncbi:hypothetical protein B0H15DRAFT_797061 [Mycena belliarum]|uniref:Uncharacterized protein n=1 Tax=Mycena belliarum TaxID=1033014 RepID=A0AAD6UEB4_9AGAR|nr:hypothetical protein B0H15DRAFT_797061 [Mycena belliae]
MLSALSLPPWASGSVVTCLSHSTWAAHSGRDSGGDKLGIGRTSTTMLFGPTELAPNGHHLHPSAAALFVAGTGHVLRRLSNPPLTPGSRSPRIAPKFSTLIEFKFQVRTARASNEFKRSPAFKRVPANLNLAAGLVIQIQAYSDMNRSDFDFSCSIPERSNFELLLWLESLEPILLDSRAVRTSSNKDTLLSSSPQCNGLERGLH